MKHKMESRFLGEITITSDMQMTQPLCRKRRETKEPLLNVKEESEKVGLKVNIHKTEIMASGPIQFSSVTQACLTLWDPMNYNTPDIPVHHQLPEFTQTHVHRVGDAMQPSHPLSSPSPPAHNPSQHKVLFQWVNSSHEVAKVLEFQIQHQSYWWTPRTNVL